VHLAVCNLYAICIKQDSGHHGTYVQYLLKAMNQLKGFRSTGRHILCPWGQSINQYFIRHPQVVQIAGQLSLPLIRITKIRKKYNYDMSDEISPTNRNGLWWNRWKKRFSERQVLSSEWNSEKVPIMHGDSSVYMLTITVHQPQYTI